MSDMVMVPGGLSDERSGKGGDLNFITGDYCADAKGIMFATPRHWHTTSLALNLSQEPLTLIHLHPSGRIEVKGTFVADDPVTYWRALYWIRGATARLGQGERGGGSATFSPEVPPDISHQFRPGVGDPPGNLSFICGETAILEYNGDTHQWSGQLPGQERFDNIEEPTLVYVLFAAWMKTAHEALYGRCPFFEGK